MRNFEDRLAQIRRRGELLKRKHKRRRLGILLTCGPLVLCIFLYAGFVLPAMMPAGAAQENTNEVYGEVMDGSVYATGIQVHTPESTWTVEDPARVESILRCLEQTVLVFESTSLHQSTTGGTADPTEEPAEGNKCQEHITLVLELGDGTQQRYLLSETSLTEEKTGKQHTIAKVQYEYLLMLLEQEEKDVVE